MVLDYVSCVFLLFDNEIYVALILDEEGTDAYLCGDEGEGSGSRWERVKGCTAVMRVRCNFLTSLILHSCARRNFSESHTLVRSSEPAPISTLPALSVLRHCLPLFWRKQALRMGEGQKNFDCASKLGLPRAQNSVQKDPLAVPWCRCAPGNMQLVYTE